MDLNLTEQERDYLLEALDAAFRDSESVMRHTYGSEFKRYLQRRMTLIEGIKSKLSVVPEEVG